MTNDATDHVVGARELWVDLSTDGDKSAWNGVHEVVVVGLKRHHDRLDLRPRRLTRPLALSYFTRANCNLVADLKTAFEDGSTSDSAFERLGVLSRLVHIERANDDHVG